jgi:hypothetical protein
MALLNTAVRYGGRALASVAASLLTRPDDLYILKIWMDTSVERPDARFELDLNPQAKIAPTKALGEWHCSTGVLGIPDQLTSNSDIPKLNELPNEMLEWLRSLMLNAPVDAPLWIHLENPAGYLRLLPWERLLQSPLKRPILRLVDLESPTPSELDNTLNVVVCASEPSAKSKFPVKVLVPQMVRAILESAPRETVSLHIFTDQNSYGSLLDHPELQDKRICIYDPASSFPPPPNDTDTRYTSMLVENVWLRWIISKLRGSSIDVVHFLCHGYFRTEQGFIAVAESPVRNVDQEWSRFIGAAELNRFLVQVGAWSVAFSAPPGNFSYAGVRQLANTMAEIRPGSVLLHEIQSDPESKMLRDSYSFLYRPGPQLAPSTSAVSIYCHPAQVQVGTPARRLVRVTAGLAPQLFGFEVSDELSEALALGVEGALRRFQNRSTGVPQWLATTQRYLELRTFELRKRERDVSGSAEQAALIAEEKKELHQIQKTAIHLAGAQLHSAEMEELSVGVA